jgi:hypothetical protein
MDLSRDPEWPEPARSAAAPRDARPACGPRLWALLGLVPGPELVDRLSDGLTNMVTAALPLL